MTIINICFHGIGVPGRELEPEEEKYWISRDLYLRVIDEIAGRDDVSVSFDDGNASDLEIGLTPLLQSDRTGTFFVLAGRLDKPGSLSSDEVRQLHQGGMHIGSHGMDHIPWRHLTTEQEVRELDGARTAIAEIVGRPVTEAALPLGRYDRHVLGALRSRAYTRVFSSDRRRARAGAWFQPRYSVHGGDTIETIRAQILQPAHLTSRLISSLKGVVKRLR